MKLKKLFLITSIMFAISLFCSISVSAQVYSGECGENLTYSLDTSTFVLTISGNGDMSYDTTDAPWFKQMASIKSVVLENGVTSIASKAFQSYTNLEKVSMADSVKTIGSAAFNGCKKLTEVTFGSGITEIEERAFFNCEKLKNIALKNGIVNIGSRAFGGCKEVEKISIPDSVEYIGDGAFYNTKYINDASNWIDGVIYIGKHLINGSGVSAIDYEVKTGTKTISSSAFQYCTNLVSITIPDSVVTIGDRAFYACENLTDVTIGKNVKSIYHDAFSQCNKLNTVNIRDLGTWCKIDFKNDNSNPMHIAYNLYLNGEPITEVNVPEGVTVISQYMFKNCNQLRNITIPKSVTKIANDAFKSCQNLNTVNITDLDAWCRIDYGNNYSNPMCYGVNLYLNGEPITKAVVPEGVTSIAPYLFKNCSSLTSLTIPESVTQIGNSAFSNCTGLTEIYWNAKAVEGENYYNQFFYCAGQDGEGIDLVFGNRVEKIPGYAFRPYDEGAPCSPKIKSVTMGEKVNYIGYGAFEGCSTIEEVNITDLDAWCKISFVDQSSNPMYFADNLLYYGEPVTKVVIPEGVTAVAPYLFNHCTELTELTIPDSVKSIGERAFWDCNKLEKITIPENVTNIGKQAFYNCTGLKQINWNGKNCRDLTKNNDVFFGGGKSIGSVKLVIGESVERIPAYAFCPSSDDLRNYLRITDVEISKSVTDIGEYAFEYCSSLRNVYYDGSVTEWESINVELFNSNLKSANIYCTPQCEVKISEKNINGDIMSLNINIHSTAIPKGLWCVGIYSPGRRLLGISTLEVTENKKDVYIPVELMAAGNPVYYKVFMFDDFSSMLPKSKVYSGQI